MALSLRGQRLRARVRVLVSAQQYTLFNPGARAAHPIVIAAAAAVVRRTVVRSGTLPRRVVTSSGPSLVRTTRVFVRAV